MQAYQKGTVVFVIAFATVMGLATTSAAQVPPDEFRTLDGMLNNVHNPTWGSAGIQLLRISRADYADGVSEPAGMTRKSPREISNILAAQLESILNHGGASDFIWQWGQFLDHDLDLTTEATPKEPLPISVPGGDPFFVPNLTGNQTLRFNRSIYDPDTGTSDQNPRQQLNLITSFIDASIDLWVGGLAEDYMPGALVGATFHAILVDQFTRLRDGDRFWFQNDQFFTGAQLTEIKNTTLAEIIRRNTRIGDEIPDNVFLIEN